MVSLLTDRTLSDDDDDDVANIIKMSVQDKRGSRMYKTPAIIHLQRIIENTVYGEEIWMFRGKNTCKCLSRLHRIRLATPNGNSKQLAAIIYKQ